MAAGLSLRALATETGASHQQLLRFERGELERVSIGDLGAWLAVVGLDLVVRAYPAGDPIRDRAHLQLLERLHQRVHSSLGWRTEVPLPIKGDQRAWDGVISGGLPAAWRVRVEAETAVADIQALERRLALKHRDDPRGHLLLLIADTRANRRALGALRLGLSHLLPLPPRSLLGALKAGLDPGGSGIVVL